MFGEMIRKRELLGLLEQSSSLFLSLPTAGANGLVQCADFRKKVQERRFLDVCFLKSAEADFLHEKITQSCRLF